MMRDRVETDTLQLSQQFLSFMLGVRNQAVSKAAISLHKSGSINYGRGQVTIVDQKQLERSACACYRLMAAHADFTPPSNKWSRSDSLLTFAYRQGTRGKTTVARASGYAL